MLIALAVTPLRQISGWNWLTRFRRMLGLFAFFYVLLHFVVWLTLDQGMLLSAIGEDIAERPFITIGFASFLILIALAATSTAGIRRRLGKTWQNLHNWVYLAAILGVWHYWWQVKLDASDPFIYAVILDGAAWLPASGNGAPAYPPGDPPDRPLVPRHGDALRAL